jgi:hypothetical protein
LETIRYRLTVIVETPEGLRSGSSVIEVQPILGTGFPFPEASGVTINVNGEATPVKLAGNAYVFAVIKWENSSDAHRSMLEASYTDKMPPDKPLDTDHPHQWHTDRISALAKSRGVRIVPKSHHPFLAYFGDASNPSTYRPVPNNDLAAVVPGLRLVGMTVEMTDAPATHKIISILPWLNKIEHGYLARDIRQYLDDRQANGHRGPRSVGPSNFILGVILPTN